MHSNAAHESRDRHLRSARRIAGFLLLVACGCVAGCGRDTGGRVPVSGAVAWKDAPLTSGTITFISAEDRTVGGALIADGAYQLPAAQGLMPGKYRVEISSPQEIAISEADYAAGKMPLGNPELIPAKYNVESTLAIEILADGENRFDFELEE